MYDDVVRSGVPDRFAELIRKLDTPSFQAQESPSQVQDSPSLAANSNIAGEVIRILEIKTLADRVFGDEDKAEAWLQRPNRALSGQRPAELLQDELGTAVVRELLEQIDHGIFA
ncbi:hypothetical protein C2U70_21060 [Bradyrhizobium guangdongense]|nr:hypothetical protein C2U70_21060 [Bradyrhizobium guangdongense]